MTSAVPNALAMLPLNNGLPPQHVIFGRSAAMRAVRAKLEGVAGVNVPVLICGESGTGKEIIAKLIHEQSPWRNGPFVKLTCPAIPGTLLESELFGYERGAFTGAYSKKPGRVEGAQQGTLFLDEISELEVGLQAKLLRLLQDGTFSRIGGQNDRHVDVRVVSATNRDLEAEIGRKNFRGDLFHRINGMSIRLPSLRERSEDIAEIAQYLLQLYSNKFKVSVPRLSASVLRRLQKYPWPGNVRELENVIRRYVILGGSLELSENLMEVIHVDVSIGEKFNIKAVTAQAVRQIEEQAIPRVLARHNGSRKATAEALGISYRMLLYKLRDFEVSSSRHSQH